MTTNRKPPTLAEVQGTLDELSAAARAEDGERYRTALEVARTQGLTEDQIKDAYQWGRRGQGAAATFGWAARQIEQLDQSATIGRRDQIDPINLLDSIDQLD